VRFGYSHRLEEDCWLLEQLIPSLWPFDWPRSWAAPYWAARASFISEQLAKDELSRRTRLYLRSLTALKEQPFYGDGK
jgi:hypothetical protein